MRGALVAIVVLSSCGHAEPGAATFWIAPDGRFGEFGDEGIGFLLADGGGFGRQSAARIAARLFPSPHALVTTVEVENIWRGPFDTTPWPNELRTVTGTLVRYEDPMFVKGTAEEFGFLPNASPILGSIRELGDTSIAGVAIRLDAERTVLLDAIRADFEERSCPASESSLYR